MTTRNVLCPKCDPSEHQPEDAEVSSLGPRSEGDGLTQCTQGHTTTDLEFQEALDAASELTRSSRVDTLVQWLRYAEDGQSPEADRG